LRLRRTFPYGLASGISWYGNNANAFLALQWYIFTGMVLLGGPYTLKMSEHVRPFYGMASDRTRIWIDICRSVSSSSISRAVVRRVIPTRRAVE